MKLFLITSSSSSSSSSSSFWVSFRNFKKNQFKPHHHHVPNLAQFRTNKLSCGCGVSSSIIISPPPPDFDFRTQILGDSRAAIAETQPELLDLADNGSLVVISKRQYGAVPPWRTEFVEPDTIWLIGTTHTSQDSAVDVERVIRAVRPDNVVVELCRSRAGIMYTGDVNEQPLKSNMFSISGNGFFGTVGRSINLGGQTALALRLLLAFFSSKLSSHVNRPFGDEFRAARKVSEEIGAQIVLGDRPIEITLERAWNSLKLKEKFGLVSSVVRGITSSSSDLDIKTLQERSSKNNTFQLYEQLSFSYPSLLQPLIHERDTYLAWSLKRSKAVNGSKKVVGVIGNGHMNGVIYSLMSDQGNLRFRDLVGLRTAPNNQYAWLNTIFNNLFRDTVIAIILWFFFHHFNLKF
ncbi:PREDICTED: traB domain-containing protein isoform X2 [Ipomoea nil]|uniref:traB domain-containing protein isoform X2 n=1 Tax=Ipomoea nil TaxID=35883 RepID=UPI000900A096|nr:PREDICTED: traB domain-containing protein isoform X2 [Ipomoea nil]